jgi:predicted dehydrogenase
MTQPLGFAVIGAGGFARFAVAQFVQRAGTRLVGVHDPDSSAMAQMLQAHPGITAFDNLDALLCEPAVDLVYIGSPPFLHHPQSLAALRAGKHVICEKPAALNRADAQALSRLAADRGLLFVVNLMQRYNPLFDAVKTLLETAVLGAFIHGYFENYASDEFLPADHWFWDETRSGGIFIEHGVHFFDLFEGWLGPGRVVAAQKIGRPGAAHITDIVQCDVLYAGQAPVRFHHAFNQPKALDRQAMRLQFERGEITLFEWVPTRLVLNCICTDDELARLKAIFPAASVDLASHADGLRAARGRGKDFSHRHQLHLETDVQQSKTDLYEGLVRCMFDDQLNWIENRSRVRKIDAVNAVRSVEVAEQADTMAVRF